MDYKLKFNKPRKEWDEEKAYLDKHIFYGLKDLNSGFDSPVIRYHSEEEFRIVLDRCEEAGIGLFGIEPWRDGEYYDVWTCEDFESVPTNPLWYRMAFEDFVSRGIKLQYSATYFVPAELPD